LSYLKIKRRVSVAVNGDEEKGLGHVLSDGDEVLVFTVISGG
jgi:molybdopterin converting factor small subunit